MGEFVADGVTYQSEMDYYQTEFLGFCGCGRVDKALEFVVHVLGLLERVNGEMPGWVEVWEHVNDDAQEAGIWMFVLYQLDNLGLTEHGTSVTGSWLTEHGEQVLKYLREHKDE